MKKNVFVFLSVLILSLGLWLSCSSFTYPNVNDSLVSLPSNNSAYVLESNSYLSARLSYPGLGDFDVDELLAHPSRKYYLFHNPNYLTSVSFSDANVENGYFTYSFKMDNFSNPIQYISDIGLTMFSISNYTPEWDLLHSHVKDFTIRDMYNGVANGPNDGNWVLNYTGDSFTFTFNSLYYTFSEVPDNFGHYRFNFYLVYNNKISSSFYVGSYEYDLFNLDGANYFSFDFVMPFNNTFHYTLNNAIPIGYSSLSNASNWYYESNNSTIIFEVLSDNNYTLNWTFFSSNYTPFNGGSSDYGLGFGAGYSAGYNDAENQVLNWTQFITSIIGSPLVFMTTISDISIFGVNIFGLFGVMFLISACMLIFRLFR